MHRVSHEDRWSYIDYLSKWKAITHVAKHPSTGRHIERALAGTLRSNHVSDVTGVKTLEKVYSLSIMMILPPSIDMSCSAYVLPLLYTIQNGHGIDNIRSVALSASHFDPH